MRNIANEFPEAMQRFRDTGFPALAEMMALFPTCQDFDRELGYNGASKHCINEKNAPSKTAEIAAKLWLEKRETGFVQPTGNTVTIIEPEDNLMLVAFPPNKGAKVRRVPEMLGCEVIE